MFIRSSRDILSLIWMIHTVEAKLIDRSELFKAFQFKFFLSTSWWLEALKMTEKIIRENSFEQKKKKPGLSAKRSSNN